MCHQSVGLIARALESAGVATTSLTSAWTITASANPPRAAFTDFPLGNTAGPPNEPETQRAIARHALGLIDEVVDPGSIVAFEHRWPSEWKAEARELRDHRTPREPTPQYANDSDRDAAIARHGEQAACAEC